MDNVTTYWEVLAYADDLPVTKRQRALLGKADYGYQNFSVAVNVCNRYPGSYVRSRHQTRSDDWSGIIVHSNL
jgi:hypothetical protein